LRMSSLAVLSLSPPFSIYRWGDRLARSLPRRSCSEGTLPKPGSPRLVSRRLRLQTCASRVPLRLSRCALGLHRWHRLIPPPRWEDLHGQCRRARLWDPGSTGLLDGRRPRGRRCLPSCRDPPRRCRARLSEPGSLGLLEGPRLHRRPRGRRCLPSSRDPPRRCRARPSQPGSVGLLGGSRLHSRPRRRQRPRRRRRRIRFRPRPCPGPFPRKFRRLWRPATWAREPGLPPRRRRRRQGRKES